MVCMRTICAIHVSEALRDTIWNTPWISRLQISVRLLESPIWCDCRFLVRNDQTTIAHLQHDENGVDESDVNSPFRACLVVQINICVWILETRWIGEYFSIKDSPWPSPPDLTGHVYHMYYCELLLSRFLSSGLLEQWNSWSRTQTAA